MNNLLAANPINNPVLGPNLQALNGTSFIQGFVRAGILLGLTVGVLFFFFNLLMGGISYINSGGDKTKTEAARDKITKALIGIIVLFSVFAFVQLVGTFLGTDLLLLNLDILRIR